VLARIGIVSIDQLTKFRGYFVVVAFIVSAIVTPPDVVSQLSLAIPLCVLYEIGILAARLFIRSTKAADETAATAK
jgi:sec-independent protein translocase protein TatC